MKFTILTILPEFFDGFLTTSLIGKARENGRIKTDLVNIRDFATDIHNTVDDVPFGGGAGMVMKPDVMSSAIEQARIDNPNAPVLAMTPRGKTFSQEKAQELSEKGSIILVCGRYEGIDQRVLNNYVDEEISIGDYVLAGGEAAALVVLEATARLVPGVMGNSSSLDEESFSKQRLEYDQYTRPREFRGEAVPDILMSGHHANIEKWRKKNALETTIQRRADLIEKYALTDEEKKLLDL